MKNIYKNIYALAFVGLAMQFGASFIHFTGNVFLVGSLLTEDGHLLIRNLSESAPHMIKIFGGYLSDTFQNRKLFLIIGYGSMIVLKCLFFLTTFRDTFSLSFLFYVYVFTQCADRAFNAFRDSARDALMVDTAQQSKNYGFGIRKAIASFGSIAAGIFCFFVIKYNYLGMKSIYAMSIVPVILANIILLKYVKNVPFTKKANTEIKIPIYEILALLIVTPIYIFNTYIGAIIHSITFLFIIFRNKWCIFKNLFLLSIFTLFFYFIIGKIIISLLVSILFSYFTYLAIQSNITQEIIKNRHKLTELFIVIGINGLVSLSRMNDTILLTHGEHLGYSSISTILFFTLLYVSILLFSVFYNFFAKKGKLILSISTVLSLFFTHCIIIFSKSKLLFLVSILSLGSFYSSSEVLLSNMLAEAIPSESLRGTSFGFFHAISGVAIFINALLVYKIKSLYSLQYASMFCIFCILLSIILFVVYFKRKK